MSEPEKRFKVLVIEDDAAISRVLSLELEHEGYEIELARDGLEGLEKALKEPDLVILDLMLPRMDGMEVCRRIRAKSRVPIIMLTARDRVPDRVSGLDTGADDYLTKPFNPRELLARIRAVLRRSGAATPIVERARHLAFSGWRMTLLCGERSRKRARTRASNSSVANGLVR